MYVTSTDYAGEGLKWKDMSMSIRFKSGDCWRAPVSEIGQFLHPMGRILSLEFNFHYFANAEFAKF